MKKLLVVISWACLAAVILSARAQPVTDPNNTIVRLNVFTGGTNFGHIDIELFDQQKPETVKNFLMYVHSGAYTNILLHVPWPAQTALGNMIQGGHIQVNDPSGNLDIVTFDRTPSLGLIPNEYSTGQSLPNVFGTIAAVPRSPRGFSVGSIDWVLNITNNAFLNTNHGGYTVFGHVVNTAGEHTGTNLLRFLGTNEMRFVGLAGDAGEDFYVPVTEVHVQRYPKTREMFLMNATIIHSSTVRDTVAPTVQVSQPAGFMTNDVMEPIAASGSASDNHGVNRVLFDYGLPYQRFVANGTENWSSNIFLNPGTNQLFFRSVDSAGNISEPVQRTIYYPFAPINLEIVDKGKVIGLTNGQFIRLGTTYRVEAKPPAGRYFLGWRGNIFSNSKLIGLAITEQTNDFGQIFFPTNLIAFFGKTYIGLSNGAYHGLFYPTNGGPPRNSGRITLNLAANGSFSGWIYPLGNRYQVRGRFDDIGTSRNVGFRGTNLIGLELSLNPDPGGERIVGRYTDGTNISDVLLFRAQKYPNPPAQVGNYSFVITPTKDTNTITGDGYGVGNVTVDATGRIKMTGTLADETPIKQTAKLLKYDAWPFYALANGGREAVLGWIRLTNGTIFTADLQWRAPHFPDMTNQIARIEGARLSNDIRLVNWTNGTITLFGDELPESISADLQANEDGSFTVIGNANNVQLGFPDSKGEFNGTLNHPTTSQLTPLRGAVVQESNIVGGFFGTKTNNGGFIIRRKP